MATALLIFATAIWGSTFIVVQDGINEMPMNMFMGERFVIATLVMIALRPRAMKMSAETFRRGVAIGCVLSLGYWTQTYGLLFTSATVSGFVTGMFVVLTPIAGLIFYKTKVGWTGWAAVALATSGLALISLKGWSFGVGEAWTLLGAAFYTFQIMWLSKWSTPATAYSIATVMVGTSAVFFMAVGIPVDGWQLPPSQASWIAVVFLAVFASAIAFIIQSWAQAQMTPTRAAVVLSFEPVFAGIFGVWVGGDKLTFRIVLGALAILGAMFLIELAPNHEEAVAEIAAPHIAP